MAETSEHVIYGDRHVRVVMTERNVYFDVAESGAEPDCVLGLSRAQMDEIVRGYGREKEQEATRGRDR